MITADYGNVEQMKDVEKDMPFTGAVTIVVLTEAIADKVTSRPFSLAIAYGCQQQEQQCFPGELITKHHKLCISAFGQLQEGANIF